MGVSTIVRPDQGEVRVETGSGILELEEPKPGKRNAKVEIRATHTNLQHPITGWVDTHSDLYAVVVEADRTGAEVEYRIEVHRRTGVDPGPPLAELANNQKVRDLVGLRPVAGQAPAPEPAYEDLGGRQGPPPSGAERARELRGQIDPQPPPAYGPQGEPLNSAAADELEDRGIPAQRQSVAPTEEETIPPAVAARMSTWGYQAALGMAELAYELTLEQGRPVTRLGTLNLAAALLTAADEAQRRTFGRVDRADHSHTRARGALRTALRVHRVPWGASGEERQAWVEAITEETAAILTLGLKLLG